MKLIKALTISALSATVVAACSHQQVENSAQQAVKEQGNKAAPTAKKFPLKSLHMVIHVLITIIGCVMINVKILKFLHI